MLAWSLTVHKSQGSEWPWIVIPLHEEQGRIVPSAQHLNTAISRASRGCIVIGQRKVLDRLAADHRPMRRITRLAKLLKG
jgi:exodeoxyribonuclease V alpha subunit